MPHPGLEPEASKVWRFRRSRLSRVDLGFRGAGFEVPRFGRLDGGEGRFGFGFGYWWLCFVLEKRRGGGGIPSSEVWRCRVVGGGGVGRGERLLYCLVWGLGFGLG